MIFTHEQTFTKKFGWNRKILSEDDFVRACKKFRIGCQFMPLRVRGFYYCVRGAHYIAVDCKLRGWLRPFTMFHELGHFMMHAPESGYTANFAGVGRNTRQEKEADAFAWACVFPLSLLMAKSNSELMEEEGYKPWMVKRRRKVYEQYGI